MDRPAAGWFARASDVGVLWKSTGKPRRCRALPHATGQLGLARSLARGLYQSNDAVSLRTSFDVNQTGADRCSVRVAPVLEAFNSPHWIRRPGIPVRAKLADERLWGHLHVAVDAEPKLACGVVRAHLKDAELYSFAFRQGRSR